MQDLHEPISGPLTKPGSRRCSLTGMTVVQSPGLSAFDPKRASYGVYRHFPPDHVIFPSRIDHGGPDSVAHPRRFLLSTELTKFSVERCLDCVQNR